MKTFKFFWTTHKWTGISLALIFAVMAVTGFLLLVKKQVAWVQPPTMQGAAGPGVEPSQFITMERLFEAVLAEGHSDFTSLGDVDRVDFRPGDRVFKVVSRSNYAEVQVCAVTGNVLHVDWRPSDLLEDIHDGSIVGGWFHSWVMPVVACGLLFLTFSGVWLWIEPMVRRRARKRRADSA